MLTQEQVQKDLTPARVHELPLWFATKYGQNLATLNVANVDTINITVTQLLDELCPLFGDVTLDELRQAIKADDLKAKPTKQERTGDQICQR